MKNKAIAHKNGNIVHMDIEIEARIEYGYILGI